MPRRRAVVSQLITLSKSGAARGASSVLLNLQPSREFFAELATAGFALFSHGLKVH